MFPLRHLIESSSINSGVTNVAIAPLIATVTLVTTAEVARELRVEPLVKLKSFALAGADLRRTYETVPIAVSKALQKAQLTIDQVDLIEIQEAFAAQVLADLKQMGVTERDYPKGNVNGSGISLGHPLDSLI